MPNLLTTVSMLILHLLHQRHVLCLCLFRSDLVIDHLLPSPPLCFSLPSDAVRTATSNHQLSTPVRTDLEIKCAWCIRLLDWRILTALLEEAVQLRERLRRVSSALEHCLGGGLTCKSSSSLGLAFNLRLSSMAFVNSADCGGAMTRLGLR